ncbi:metal-dependent transcriptional regulator [Tamlana fucoidanivorans]|uniref:Transcriptional regulator MntR n=1 Tax=Allotamlana fucoidanivorans TaxID=2583814 RepID=A0A5C4SNM5_9FLAO|nr:metal-dependent transcriptional regulator [Tamlana fucoidanivorans]TNJ45408.1 metal-dependent transcriptional regulator [Tamlana fucoidanivorans]
MITLTEENYIKAIYHLGKYGAHNVSTNAIAKEMETKASSVTDMVKKLSEKGYADYKKYQGVTLTEEGKEIALSIVRKHRLWEVFLVDHLNFSWDEVHEVAEQLEHIKSKKLIEQLDAFLGFPTHDPHGDPIPDKSGHIKKIDKILLSEAQVGHRGICVGVKDSSSNFLKYLDKNSIALGTEIEIIHREPFDHSITIQANNKELIISNLIANNLFIRVS